MGAGIVATSGKQIKDWFSGTRPSESEKPVENSDISKEDETRTDPLATGDSPFSYEGTDYEQAKAAESRTIQETEEFEKLRESRLSRSEKRKVEKLEKELESYQEPEAMYQAQGSNGFIHGYRKAMSKDDILKENIRRKNDIINELNKLRGER